MDASFGEMLRSVRQSRGLSLVKFSGLIHYSPALIGHVENGLRQPTQPFAEAVDEALNADGLFIDLARIGGDDEVYRRTLIRALGTLGGIGAIAPLAVAENIRHSLNHAAGIANDAEDWDSIVAAYGRGFMAEPLPALARRAVGDLMVLSADPTLRGRHGARIAMVYGSSVASLGDPVSARRWYGTAVALADNTADLGLRAWSRARLAYRVFYEGGTEKEVLSATEMPIATNRPSPALIEAHAARAHVYAGRGDKALATKSLEAAYQTLDSVGSQDDISIFSMPDWRLAIAASWAYTALGDSARAEAAQTEAVKLPAEAIRWAAQVEMHRAWGAVQRDDIDAGAERASELLTTERSRVIHGLGQRVYRAIPSGERKRSAVRHFANLLEQT